MSTDRPVNLLALDGGGVRGVSELVILDKIMRKVQELDNLEELPKPCEFFDLIAGTSTGGLIAIMLGRLQMSTTEALAAYDSFAEKIFSVRNKSKRALVRRGAMFKSHILKRAVQDLVQGRGMGDLMLAPDDPERGRMFVCARPTNATNGVYRRFRSYAVSGDNWGEDCRVWEAARATSAAPFYFDAMEITSNGKTESFVDAALGCNNPLNELLSEAAEIFGKDRRLGCILSLGTGTRSLPNDLAPPSGIIGTVRWGVRVIKVLKELAVDTEKDGYEVKERLRLFEDTMFRFNVEGGANDISLASYGKIDELKSRTREYLAQSTIREDIKTVAEILAGHRMGPGLTVGHVCFLDKDQILTADGSANLVVIPTPFFTGREKILDSLAAHFVSRDPQVDEIVRRQYLLYGMGGSGKSQIARKFVQMYRDRFKYAFWVDATNRVTFQESYIAIAHSVLPSGDSRSASMQDVLRWFDNSTEEWLLVVDNWSKENSWSSLPKVDRGSYLFTSREISISNLPANCRTCVAEMEEEDAATLLLRTADEDDEYNEHRKTAKEIVRELGHLPLAIDQAGGYIRKSGIHIGRYLGIFRAQRKAMLSLPLMKGSSQEDLPVYATFDLSYKKLIELSKRSRASSQALEARSALQLLDIICFFHNEGLTKDIFRRAAADRFEGKHGPWFPLATSKDSPAALIQTDNGGNWDPNPVMLGFNLLQKMSLVKETARDVWSMHILTHSWARDRMDPAIRVRQALSARALLFESIQRGDRSEDVIHRRAILAHLDVCTGLMPLERLPERAFDHCISSQPRTKDLKAIPQAVEYFGERHGGSPLPDADLIRRALPWNNDTIESEYHFRYGMVYREHRMFIKFEEELSQALRGKQRAFGTHAPETLDVLDLMHGLEQEKGNLWGSLALRLELLERSEKDPGPGPQHAHTIMARRSLVHHYILHECHQEALQCLQAVQEAEENNSTKDPWIAAKDEATVAQMHWHQSPGDREAADRMLQASLHLWELSKATLGQDSPKTVDAMLSAARDLGKIAGRWLESTLMCWDAVHIRRRMYGFDHPETLDALRDFAITAVNYFYQVKAPQEAFDELAMMAHGVYKHCRLSRGPYHGITINTLATLSVILQRQGDLKAARKLMGRVWWRSTHTYGVEHPVTDQWRRSYNIFDEEELEITVDIMRSYRARQTQDLTSQSLEELQQVRGLLVI